MERRIEGYKPLHYTGLPLNRYVISVCSSQVV